MPQGLDYFGVAMEGGAVGFIVDGDVTMAPYLERVAMVTQSVAARLEPGTHRFGIVQAGTAGAAAIFEVRTGAAHVSGAGYALRAHPLATRTDLPAAIDTANTWHADQLFVVVSKRLEPDEEAALGRNLAKTRAAANVIALGEAAKQDLSSLTAATGGRFVAVSDEQLAEIGARADPAPNAR